MQSKGSIFSIGEAGVFFAGLSRTHSIPPWGQIRWRPELEQETELSLLDLQPSEKITEAAWDEIRGLDNAEVRRLAEKILTSISSKLPIIGYIADLPSIYGSRGEDGSLLLEWIFSQFRIGFAFESDIQESSWYLVSDRDHGGISVSGLLDSVNIEPIVLWLLSFIVISTLST